MLVLKRNVGESLTIFTSDGPVTITVVDTRWRKGEMRLAIAAPKVCRVMRDELLAKVRTPPEVNDD